MGSTATGLNFVLAEQILLNCPHQHCNVLLPLVKDTPRLFR